MLTSEIEVCITVNTFFAICCVVSLLSLMNERFISNAETSASFSTALAENFSILSNA